MGFFDPNEMALLESQAQAQDRRVTAALSATPQSAAQISAMQQAYPHVSPFVTVPLASQGVAPSSPVAAKVADSEVKRKASRGFGWHSIGDVITGAMSKAKSVGSAITPDFVGDTLNAAPLKAATRGVFSALDAVPQSVQAAFREESQGNFGHAQHDLFAQTNLGQMVSGKEAGSGFFVGGAAHRSQVQAARDAAPLINGHATTLGRYYGAKVFHPGSKPYNVLSGLVDGAVQLGADPSTYAAGPIKSGIEGAKLFAGEASRGFAKNTAAHAVQLQLAGGVKGALRNTVLPDRVAEWMVSKPGQKIVDHLVQTSDYNDLRRMFKGKIDSDTLVQLADAKTSDEVYQVLGPKLGVDIRQKLQPGATTALGLGVDQTPKALIRQSLENVRMAGAVPAKHVDLHDADDAVEQLDRMMLNFKADPAVRAQMVEKMARAGSPNARFEVLTDALKGQQGVLRGMGLDSEKANALTRLYADYTRDGARYAVDEIGGNMMVPGVVLDAAGQATPTPHLLAEYVGRAVPLPDARAVRAATSKFGRVIEGVPGLKPGVAALDFVSQQMFKPLVLLRGAWTVRVVGEEQIRLAAAGRSSILNHPLSHIAVATGRKLGTGIAGDVLKDTDEALKALSRGSGNLLSDPSKVAIYRQRLYERGLPGYNRAWADELASLHLDPVGQRLANGGLLAGDKTPNALPGIDGVKDWFFNGTGRKFRLEMADAPNRDVLKTRQGADAYVDSVMARLVAKTGGDPDLHSIVASGKFNGQDVFHAPLQPKANRKARRASDDLIAELDSRAQAGTAPAKVKGDDYITARDRPGQAAFAAKDRAVEALFNTLMSRPTNFLSRSPAFKYFYYQRAGELIGFMSKDAQAAAIKAAEDAGLDSKQLKAWRETAKRQSGDLDLEHADILAKGHGLDKTRELLYDLHERSQFFDINRSLFPFGEAWKEVLGVWAKIGMENPVLPRRAGQVVQGARSADVDGDGRGIFYPDPLTGEEMIAFPFSEEFSQLATGVPIKMQGTAKGLNVFSQSVLPGFGPVVQIAAGKLLPEDPSFDGVRNALIPFGNNDTSGGIVESFLPAWYKKFQTSGWVIPDRRSQKQERAYNNTVTDVMRYLLSTGDYSVGTPEEQDRLINDAKHKASMVYMLRGMTQFWAPTAPSTEFVAKDKTGRAILTFKLAEEYRKMQQQDYKTATARFIDKFGENAFLSTIPKTSGGGATTKGALDFARRHPDVEREYRDVFAYFTKPDDQFDMTAYQRQLDTGQRQVRTPQEAIDLANQRIATMIYSRAREKVGDKPDAQGRAFLREIKDTLVQQYPGYSSVPADMSKTPKLIDELLRAGSNEHLAATDAGKGLRLYTAAREKARAEARSMGLESFDKSDKAVGIRNWLRDVGEAITSEHPEFATMFDQVLERELGDDQRGVSNG